MTNVLSISIVNSPEDAPHYANDYPDISAATITKAIVVKNGTVNGAPTVDVLITTSDGKEHVAMITGALIKALARSIEAVDGPI